MAEEKMRVAMTQSLVSALKRLPPREVDDIRGRAGRGALEQIDGALALGWIEMAVHMRVADATHDVLGPDRNVELWRTAMTDTWDRPLLRGFVVMSTSLFGTTPASLMRQADRLYPHMTRGLGTIACEVLSDTEGTAELRSFPHARYGFSCYVEGLRGCFESTFDVCRTPGTVAVERMDEARGTAMYRLKWKRPR